MHVFKGLACAAAVSNIVFFEWAVTGFGFHQHLACQPAMKCPAIALQVAWSERRVYTDHTFSLRYSRSHRKVGCGQEFKVRARKVSNIQITVP